MGNGKWAMGAKSADHLCDQPSGLGVSSEVLHLPVPSCIVPPLFLGRWNETNRGKPQDHTRPK